MINSSLLTSEKPLRVKTGETNGDKVKLTFSDNQAIEVSSKYLPKKAKPGDVLYLSLITEDELELNRKEIARAVLDDILSQE